MSKSFADAFRDFEEFALPEEIASRFTILESLAQNEYGETYLLSEKNSGKRFVLKCYRKSNDVNTTHEAELLRELEHQCLPRFEAEIENEQWLYVLREYAKGIPLEQYRAEYPIDETKAVSIMIKLCSVLSYLHSQPAPIIHRDIKPSNIVIDPSDDTLTLIDFGISRKYNKEAETDTSFFGTQKFAPPEQYGFAQTDCRADIYALGVVLRYILTGTTDTKVDVKDKSLKRIVNKCTAFSPDARYQSAAALQKALIMHNNRTKQKRLFAVGVLLIACVMFVSGFAVGRYTKLFQLETAKQDENIMVFTEPLIEKAVRLTLGKADGEPVLRDELKNMNSLYIVGMEAATTSEEFYQLRGKFMPENLPYGTIESLEDLKTMENLVTIFIAGQPLSDISAIASNFSLTEIDITHCGIADVSPLTNLPRLRGIELYDNRISDVSAFREMKALERLGIGTSPLRSLFELGDIPYMVSLNIQRTQITSLDGIENYPFLEELSVAETSITDFSPLNELPRMKVLRISEDMEKYLNTLNRDDIEINIQ